MTFSFSFAFLLVSLSTLTSSEPVLWTDFPDSLDTFSGRFYKEAVNQPDNINKNVVLSSLSADVVMTMITLGAQDETRKELTDVLAIKNVESVEPSLKQTLTYLNNIKGVELKLANKIYVRQYGNKLDSVAPTYKTVVQDVFKSEIQNIDFSRNTVAAKEINEWVESKTNRRIKNLIDPDSLSSDTATVIVNAIYFKGTWQKVFDLDDTKKEHFHLADGSTTQVDMMYQKAHFFFKNSDELDSKIVVLPYTDDAVMSMVVILPNKIDGIKEVEAKLASGSRRFLKVFNEVEIELRLPRFKIASTIDVKDAFLKLGATRVFDPNLAQLTDILSEPTELFVSKAIQKAFIEVNEKGTEAAAATYAETEDRIAGGPVPFTADHPFLVQIVTGLGISVDEICFDCIDINGDAIFTARVMNPNSGLDSE